MTFKAMIDTFRMPAAAAAVVLLGTPVFAQDVKLDVPYVPTPDAVVAKMLDLVEIQKGERLIDLGSGDGRIAIAAAKRGAEAYGVDINPVRVEEAKGNAQKEGVAGQATFEVKNLFDTNIEQFDIVTMYLLPSVNRDLRPRLLEMKPGTRLVSHAFDMGEWKADITENVEGRTVFFWRVPAKVDGQWTLQHDGASIPVNLTQSFQNVTGTATVKGASTPVTGKVDGEMVNLVVGSGDAQTVFNGRVSENALEPVAAEGAAQNWTATRG